MHFRRAVVVYLSDIFKSFLAEGRDGHVSVSQYTYISRWVFMSTRSYGLHRSFSLVGALRERSELRDNYYILCFCC
jgi:hypothetical protein